MKFFFFFFFRSTFYFTHFFASSVRVVKHDHLNHSLGRRWCFNSFLEKRLNFSTSSRTMTIHTTQHSTQTKAKTIFYFFTSYASRKSVSSCAFSLHFVRSVCYWFRPFSLPIYRLLNFISTDENKVTLFSMFLFFNLLKFCRCIGSDTFY